METRDYSTWSLDVKQRVAGRRSPLAGTLELTRRCNHRCRHCYNNLPGADPRALAEELRTEEWIRLLDELTAAGCVWLLLTGGEILLRPDFKEIYRHAKQKGLLVTLFTNGTLVTSELAEFLNRHRPFSIEVTLYGATREVYENVTGTPGSYDRCMRGVRHLRDCRLPLKLKAAISTLNRHEVRAMQRLSESGLGLPFRFDALLNARCDGRDGPLQVRLTPEEVVQLDLGDPARAAALRDIARERNARGAPHANRPLFPCGAGAYSFAIDPYGRLRACIISPGDGFDIRAAGFPEGWDMYLSRLSALRNERQTKCLACSLRDLCGMCPANGELECGDPEKPVDFLCRVAHLRARAFGIQVPAHGDCEYCSAAAP